MPPSSLPLAGVRVADFSRVVAGPYCSMLLADLGAEVIKVERPGVGDDTRAWGPPFAGSESAYYLSLNRNKQSLELDLKAAADRRLAQALIRESQVLLHNFQPSDALKLGLDEAAVRVLNPAIVYALISGYGSSGPDAHKPGYDLLAQAVTGLMSITGEAQGEGMKVGVAIIDVLAGLNTALGIVASLYEGKRAGGGRRVESSLLEAGLSSLINVASNYLISGETPGRYGNAHPNIVPYQPFGTSDAPLVLAVGNDRQFRDLMRVLGEEALADDERYASNRARVRNREALVAHLQGYFEQQTRAYWLEQLEGAEVPCAPLNTVAEALAGEGVTARAMLQRAQHPTLGELPLVANGLKLDGVATPLYRHPPLLGEDNAALRAWLERLASAASPEES